MQIFLLAALAFVGWMLFSLMGLEFIKLCFFLDPFEHPEVLQDLHNPDAVEANRWFLIFEHLGLFVFPAAGMYFINLRQGIVMWEFRSVSVKFVLGAIMLFVASLYALDWIIYLNQHVSLPELLSDWEQSMREMEDNAAAWTNAIIQFETAGDFLLNFAILAVLPAISEELLFRGTLQPLLLRKFANPHLAIWITALLFSTLHFQFFGFFPRLILGALLGYFYFTSGNLGLSMGLHFLNNGLTLVLISAGWSSLESGELATWQWILSLCLTVGLFIFYRWYLGQKGFQISASKPLE